MIRLTETGGLDNRYSRAAGLEAVEAKSVTERVMSAMRRSRNLTGRSKG